MGIAYITPSKDCLYVEFREKASPGLNSAVNQTSWLAWKKLNDLNGKGKQQWYIVVNTTVEKENRLMNFSRILCHNEGYTPSPKICPHDQYYEDFEKYFAKYL